MNRCLSLSVLVAAMFLAGFGSVAARDWPDSPDKVIRSFGVSTEGSFSRGLEFASEGQRVTAWRDGEVIWLDKAGDRDIVVIQHSGGFRTSYRRIESHPDLPHRIFTGDWIGYAGDDSWIFTVADLKKGRIVDPIRFLPTREAMPPPTIGSVEIVRGTQRRPLQDGMDVPSGRWIPAINEPFVQRGGALPLEISLYWVGEQISGLQFIALLETAGLVALETPSIKFYNQVYDADGRLLLPGISLNPGRGTLELHIKDETDQVIVRSWNLRVQ